TEPWRSPGLPSSSFRHAPRGSFHRNIALRREHLLRIFRLAIVYVNLIGDKEAAMSGRITRPRHAWTAAVIVGFLLFALSHQAIAGQQEASIIGVVTDESGGVLPGVTVTATSPALQVPSMVAVTDEHGEYRLTPL